MKRVGGRSCHCDQPDHSPSAHSASTSSQTHQYSVPRKTWRTRRRLAGYLFMSLMIFPLLLCTWVSAPPRFTPLLHSFEFKIYERDKFGQNASRPGRNILNHGHPHDYGEALSHTSWTVHGSQGCFTASLFYIIMEVGIHHKPFFLDIDTGSSLTWVHCRLHPALASPKQGPNGLFEAVDSDRVLLCNDELCSIADEYHNPHDCDDDDPDYCQYDLHYADHLKTWGVLVQDSVGLTLHSRLVDVEVVFGCGYHQAGCEYELGPDKPPGLPSDGILGLSKRPASIPSQLHAKRFIRHLISHCFLPFHKRTGTHVGILLLGESGMTTKGIGWAKMIMRDHMPIQSAYEGEMVQAKYGNRRVASFVKDHPERFVAFDSGTAMIWLTKGLFLALRDQISAEADRIGHKALPNTASGHLAIGGPRCWKIKSSSLVVWALGLDSLKEAPFRHFKDITFGFTPDQAKRCMALVPSFLCPFAKFVMPPPNYLTINGDDADIICLALFADETNTFQTFGAYALKGLVFVVDNEMNRIGWRTSDDCQ